MGTGWPLPGVKRSQGRDADHSPLSSAEIKNEQELYLLFPQAPSWRVTGQLYFFYFIYIVINTGKSSSVTENLLNFRSISSIVFGYFKTLEFQCYAEWNLPTKHLFLNQQFR
jgi:hypothetical protein